MMPKHFLSLQSLSKGTDNSKGRNLQSKQSKASVVRKEPDRCRFGLADPHTIRHCSLPLHLNDHRKDKPQFKRDSGPPALYSHYKLKNERTK